VALVRLTPSLACFFYSSSLPETASHDPHPDLIAFQIDCHIPTFYMLYHYVHVSTQCDMSGFPNNNEPGPSNATNDVDPGPSHGYRYS
jgi:hypothetical protein